jgi:hypothetical protein
MQYPNGAPSRSPFPSRFPQFPLPLPRCIMSSVTFLVFSQSAESVLPIDRLTSQACVHFGAVLSPSGAGSGATRLSYGSHGDQGDFDVVVRISGPPDVAAAERVERGAPTGGLADLALRCKTVWEIEARGEPPEWLQFEFAGVLASIALGPILTPDGSSLLGVRGARERAYRLRGAPPLTR